MSDTGTLDDYLQAALTDTAADPAAVSANDLAALWVQIFPGQDGPTRTGLRTFQTAFRAGVADSQAEEALNLRGGGWVVDLRGGLVRSALATAFIARRPDRLRHYRLATSGRPSRSAPAVRCAPSPPHALPGTRPRRTPAHP